jgi:hypothetical protein
VRVDDTPFPFFTDDSRDDWHEASQDKQIDFGRNRFLKNATEHLSALQAFDQQSGDPSVLRPDDGIALPVCHEQLDLHAQFITSIDQGLKIASPARGENND